jgi:hypothetical protein
MLNGRSSFEMRARQVSDASRKAGKPFQRAIVGRGAAFGDFDNDGDLDVLLTSNGGPAYLWRNAGAVKTGR